MPTPLDDAIDSLSSGDPLAVSLNGLLTISRRIKATQLTEALRSELLGYPADAQLPTYRDFSDLPVTIRFDAYGGGGEHFTVPQRELPKHLRQEDVGFRWPISELEALIAHGEEAKSDPRFSLPTAWVMEYREQLSARKVPGLGGFYVANEAELRVPRSHLTGRLGQLRTTMLELALDFQEISSDIGTSGGPTVTTEPRLGQVIMLNSTLIIGNDNVAAGDGATVVKLQAGDVDGLLQTIRDTYTAELADELKAALDQDGGQPAAATKTLLDRIKSGSASIALGMTGNGAYDGFVQLLQQVFPGF